MTEHPGDGWTRTFQRTIDMKRLGGEPRREIDAVDRERRDAAEGVIHRHAWSIATSGFDDRGFGESRRRDGREDSDAPIRTFEVTSSQAALRNARGAGDGHRELGAQLERDRGVTAHPARMSCAP